MRRILTSVVLLVLLFPGLAFGETMDDLVVREGIHYKKFSTVPFTGKVTGKIQVSFKDGKRDGPWVYYHGNGQLKSKGIFKNGKFDGPWVVYYDNGQLRSKGTFKDGEWDGPWVVYNEDGTVDEKYTGTHKDGVKVK